MSEVNQLIIPFSIVMMAGPQIISPILMMTTDKPGRVLVVYALAVGLATTIGTILFYLLFQFLGIDSMVQGESTIGKLINTGLIILLIYLAINTFIHRKEAKTPKWMSGLQNKTVKGSFLLGLGLILLMPTDLIAMSSVALILLSYQQSVWSYWPYLLATVFIASIPLLLFLLFHKRINDKMDSIRSWINRNNWIIQIAIYIVFIFLLWG